MCRRYGRVCPLSSARAAGHALCALAGFAILALSVPHDAPWQMRLVRGEPAPGAIRVAVFGGSIQVRFALLMGGLGVLAAAAVAVMWRQIRAIEPRRLAVLVSLALGFAATLAPSPYGWWITLYLALAGSGFTLAWIGLLPLVDRALGSALARRLLGAARRRFDDLPGFGVASLAALAVFAAAALASTFCFQHLPHVEDSGAQYFQGKIFALGRLTVPSPGLHEFFAFPHVIDDGRWYSIYPPGHAMLLALGHLAGAPWLVNPLFGALDVALLYLLGRDFFDERTGKLAAVLGALSPFLVFMSAEFMNHTTTLFFFELFLLGYVRFTRTGGAGSGLLSGLGAGCAFLIRPLTAAAVVAPFAIDALARLVNAGRQHRRPLATAFGSAALAFALLVGLFLAYNAATNGSPFVSGYQKLYGSENDLGFGHALVGEPHTPAEGLRQTLRDSNALEKYLFELPVPSLLLAFVALAAPEASRFDWLLAASPVALAFAYFFYWFQDWCFGPRYLFEATAPLVLLSARGLGGLPGVIGRLFAVDRERARAHVAAVLIAAFAVGWASNLHALIRLYASDYFDASSATVVEARRLGLHDAIVFVRDSYKGEFPQNDPRLDGDVIYARDLGAKRNLELLSRFPARTSYLADHGRVYRVVVRP